MIDLTQDGVTHEEVLAALQFSGGRRRVRYELWALRDGAAFRQLTFRKKSLRCDYLSAVKYRGSFTVQADPLVDWHSDLLQLVMVVQAAGKELRYAFVRLKPMRVQGLRELHVEAQDETVMLKMSSLGERVFIPAGESYRRVITDALSAAQFDGVLIEPSAAVFAQDREDWEPETQRLSFINQLLGEIGYRSLEAERGGIVRAGPYVTPGRTQSGIYYAAGPRSVILGVRDRVTDAFGKPNRFIGYVSRPDAAPLRYEYVNDNPASPTSPDRNGGYVLTAARRFEAADAPALEKNVLQWATDSGQAYETLELETAVMPHHGVREIVNVECAAASGTFTEVGWEIGETMLHTLRRLTG